MQGFKPGKLSVSGNQSYYGLTWTVADMTSSLGVYGDPCIIADSAGNFYYFHLSGPPSVSLLDRIVCQKSTDRDLTWPSGNLTVSALKQGWSFDVPGLYSCNGMPVTCCDYSNGPYRGNIYINWSDQKSGVDNTDIFLSKSTDGGQTWSLPKLVNNDSSNRHQFMSSMTVDQSTGILYFVFYDRRNYSDLNTDVYLAISRDGGESFQNVKISEKPFVPNASIFFGDYTAISSVNNRVRPVWTHLNEGILSMMVAIVDSASHLQAPEQEPAIPACLEQNYPNPASSFTYFSFRLNRQSEVTLILVDCSGKTVAELLNRKKLPAGKYAEGIDLLTMGLEPGIYFYQLRTSDFIATKKMVMYIP